jgi:uncharacterized membrane protein (UPF0127 family)
MIYLNSITPDLVLYLDHNRLEVAIAIDEAKGLAGFKLEEDQGMLFLDGTAFWMKGVSYPLDIVFIGKQGNIVDIQTMPVLRKGDYPTIYSSRAESVAALELTGGYCARHNITTLTKLTLER